MLHPSIRHTPLVFLFWSVKKRMKIRCALEVRRSILKEQVEMPKAIVTDRNTALMNAVAKVFLSSNTLICRYHITCDVRSKVKLAVGTKQVETNGGKSVKPDVIVE